ncbi:hypothetical protein BGW38_002451 [Lunasporangiospora selenospora]|uniref:RRM domain-containing protein n=1 Tax=Lunasporangiospora selenospora TaxID=979761 RepID=A0A9P6KDD5_9FUNG|nr:hypothetical protein BGW38_002451 [Lunasporangiospora selenospora]
MLVTNGLPDTWTFVNAFLPTLYAFVEYEDDRDARDAYNRMKDFRFDGYRLTVQFAKNTPRSSWRYDGGRGRSRSPPPPNSSARRDRSPPRRRSPRRRSPSPPSTSAAPGPGASARRPREDSRSPERNASREADRDQERDRNRERDRRERSASPRGRDRGRERGRRESRSRSPAQRSCKYNNSDDSNGRRRDVDGDLEMEEDDSRRDENGGSPSPPGRSVSPRQRSESV